MMRLKNVRDFIRARWWRLRVAVRRLRGIRGDFEQGEISARAAELTSKWMKRWPEFAPSPRGQTHLHAGYSRGYVRFHSLADHSQGRFTEAEMAEAMTRHEVALADLIELAGDPVVLVIAADWGKDDFFGAWSRTIFPGSWPWLRWRDPGDEEDDPFTYFWVTPINSLASLIGPLERVVEEQGHVYITDAGMNWIYFPYDGGADVYSASIEIATTLRERHSDWLPPD